jgi:hypothetical protein
MPVPMQAQPKETGSSLTENLHRMADEIRLKIHLAGMEAKETWSTIEPRLHEFERKAENAKDKLVDGLDKVGDELRDQMSKLLDRIRGN